MPTGGILPYGSAPWSRDTFGLGAAPVHPGAVLRQRFLAQKFLARCQKRPSNSYCIVKHVQAVVCLRFRKKPFSTGQKDQRGDCHEDFNYETVDDGNCHTRLGRWVRIACPRECSGQVDPQRTAANPSVLALRTGDQNGRGSMCSGVLRGFLPVQVRGDRR